MPLLPSWAIAIALLVTLAFWALVALVIAMRVQVRYRLEAPGRMDDPTFLPALDGLTNSPSRSIAGFRVYGDPGAIYAAMAEAIAGATRSITLETYLFWSGRVADTFVAALAERAKAGVQVKILLDADGSRHLHAETLAALRSAGCEVRFFRPLVWYQPVQYNHRTHRKILVVDGAIGFTGGIGIADMWLGPPPWLELMVRLEGAVVGLLQGAFFQNWAVAGGGLNLGETFFPPLEELAARPQGMVTTSSPIWGDSMMRLLYYSAIASARTRLWLVTPYFLPNRDTLEALAKAAAAGVDVRLVLPGPQNDKRLPYYASRLHYGPLLRAGVRLFEYLPAMMHAKAMVVDGTWATFGSTNFDPRSFFLNSELNVSVRDPAFAAELEAFTEGAIAASHEVTYAEWEQRGWAERLLARVGMLIKDQL